MGADTMPASTCTRHCQHFRQHNHLRTIAAVGDSITYGTCAVTALVIVARRIAPRPLAGRIRRSVRVLNFGASGRTMTRSGDNVPYWDDAEFEEVESFEGGFDLVGRGVLAEERVIITGTVMLSSRMPGIWSPFSRAERRGLPCRAAAVFTKRGRPSP